MSTRDQSQHYSALPPQPAASTPPVPPQLLPSSSSSFAQILSAVSRGRSDTGDEVRHTFVPAGAEEPLEELFWEGRRVTLSRGGHIHQTYDLEEVGEDVTQALFVDFQTVTGGAPPSSWAGIAAWAMTVLTPSSSSSLFGPYAVPVETSWSDSPLPLPSNPAPQRPALNVRHERTLVVILSTLAFAFPSSGNRIPIPLPFRVRRAWAMRDGGILAERAREGHEIWAQRDAELEKPALWSLRGCGEEWKPVTNLVGSPLSDGALAQDLGPSPNLKPEQKIVFCTPPLPPPSRSSKATTSALTFPPSLVLTADTTSSTLCLHVVTALSPSASSLAYNPPSHSSTTKEKAPKPQPSHPSQTTKEPLSSPILLRTSSIAPPPAAASSGMSRGRGSLSGTKRKHPSDSPSSVHFSEERDRSIRRTSGMGAGGSPFGGGGGGGSNAAGRPRSSLTRLPSFGTTLALGQGAEVQEQDLLEALASLVAGGDRSFSRHTTNNADRRTSTSRNDLSVTMDRMALSQGSSAGGFFGGDKEREREWAEVEREATFYLPHLPGQGELGDLPGSPEHDTEWDDGLLGVKSEIGLRKIWEVDGLGSVEGATAHLFDQQSTSSLLAIHLPASSSLLILTLSTNPSGEFVASPLRQFAASDCTSVLGTRACAGIRDLLVFRPEGGAGLLTAGGREIDLSLPPSWLEGVTGVDGNSGMSVVLNFASGQRRTLPVASLVDGFKREELGHICVEALAQVLLLDDFVRLLSSILEKERELADGRDRRWRALKAVLHELYATPDPSSSPRPSNAYESFLASSSASSSGDPILSFFAHSPSAPASHTLPPAMQEPPSPQQQAILSALHLVGQDLRLRASPEKRRDATRLSRKVGVWAARCGLEGWRDYYSRQLGQFVPPSPPPSPVTGGPSLIIPTTPPDLLLHLTLLLHGVTPPELRCPFSLRTVAYRHQTAATPRFYGPSSQPLSLSGHLLSLYTLLVTPATSTTTARAHATVAAVYRLQRDGELPPLDELTWALTLPLREAIRMGQLEPPEPGSSAAEKAGWVEAGVYELVGRADLARQLDGLVPAALPSARQGIPRPGADGEILAPQTTASRFNEDKRLDEVRRMLQFEQPVVITAGDRTLDQLTPQIQQSILLALSYRTLALPIGHSIFHFRSSPHSSSTPTTAITVPKVNTSARVLPMASPVSLAEKDTRDPSNPAAPPTNDRFEWPDFHAGVGAALALPATSSSSTFSFETGEGLDASQLSFNRPADLSSSHAGLLLGLGLTGQLRSMLSSQAYDYLKSKHDPTSVALLLGLAVSYLAISDPTVTSVVSIHLPALHPPRSSSLNVSGITQAAAAVALGLVHFGTSRRSFADVLLREITKARVTSLEDATACREAYALSCGFGFGMIMLGAGRAANELESKLVGVRKTNGTTAAKEVELLRTFRSLILGSGASSPSAGGSSFSSSSGSGEFDLNITSPSATIALALMYLRSNRSDVAEMLDIPTTARGLDYVRPDLLLVRTVARNLIMWNGVEKGRDWVERQLPEFLREKEGSRRDGDGDEDIARWAIIAGACFAIGLKHAGTATADAHGTLIYYLDRLTRASYTKVTTVHGKLKRAALRSSLCAVVLSLAMVMAGTGEINVLRRLRVAHGLYSEGVSHASHLATHMALGLLFIGEGKYTLGNSDTAVAALFLSLYPAFPSSPTENRGHLQAYRHLWVLAAEPRYLDAVDVDTGEPVFLPVKLRLADSTPFSSSSSKPDMRSKQLVAPTIIPELRHIESISIDSPRYWAFYLRLSTNPHHFARFLASSTLYVKRRTGHLSYSQDPRGIRSIFTRSKSETGSSVFDLGEMGRVLNPSAGGLKDFVAAFSGADDEALAATQELCYDGVSERLPSGFEAFAASALLECLTKDKRDVVGVYRAIYLAAKSLDSDALSQTNTAEGTANLLYDAAQLRFVVGFYQHGAFKSLFSKPKPGFSKPSSSSSASAGGSSSSQLVSRDPLLSPAFIEHLNHRLTTLTSSLVAVELNCASLKTYLSLPGFPLTPSTSNEASPLVISYLLTSLRLPPFATIQKLQSMTRTLHPDDTGREELAVLLRTVGKKIAEQQYGEKKGAKIGAWEREADRWMAESWAVAGQTNVAQA
ncbi:hypothetical protein JCM11641_007058 [Rhodosporidiobolus odoratus]